MPPHSQLQLDIYGELADVMAQARAGGLPPPPRRDGTARRFSWTIWKKSGACRTKASGKSAARRSISSIPR